MISRNRPFLGSIYLYASLICCYKALGSNAFSAFRSLQPTIKHPGTSPLSSWTLVPTEQPETKWKLNVLSETSKDRPLVRYDADEQKMHNRMNNLSIKSFFINNNMIKICMIAILISFPAPSNAIELGGRISSLLMQQQQHLEQGRLADTDAFKSLRKESPESRAVQSINKLKDLQDERLAQCADRGAFWEQCFMFGEAKDSRDIQNGDVPDYQLVSPMGAFEPKFGNKKNGMPPTW